MKKIIALLIIISLSVSFSACSKQDTDLVIMSYGVSDEYATIVWGANIYIPYGPISRNDCGTQIGFIDGNENDKIYEFRDYSTDEWIISTLPNDPPMLWRETNVTDIPEGLQSEYEWNN